MGRIELVEVLLGIFETELVISVTSCARLLSISPSTDLSALIEETI